MGRQRHRTSGGGRRRDFPDMTGLSARNLSYMKAFAEAYPDSGFLQQVVANCHGATMSAFWRR
jgi:hypothetical protein